MALGGRRDRQRTNDTIFVGNDRGSNANDARLVLFAVKGDAIGTDHLKFPFEFECIGMC